jgi:hypothetical protein
MIDKQSVALVARIAGIVVSIVSSVILFIKPFEAVTNTLAVYFLLIAAAALVMIGQLITVKINQPGEFKDVTKRHEALYDLATVGIVMVLFVFLYVIPYIQTHTGWLL